MCDMSMSAKANLKSKFPCRYVTDGPERAPNRSYYFAAGLTIEQSQYPCIADLKPAGRYVAKDLSEAGGVPLLSRRIGTVLRGAATHQGGLAETSTYADI
jgi:dihydroxy-acid dehydratase